MRALAADTQSALAAVAGEICPHHKIARWTGDVSASQRKKIRTSPPSTLILTPESLSLLLSHEEWAPKFSSLRSVIVDEWHELLSSKRGVMTELLLARLRTLSPQVVVWGLSATLGNLEEAARVLRGGIAASRFRIVAGEKHKQVRVTSILPREKNTIPWAGHLGIALVSRVAERLRTCQSAIVFTNTRSQAEIWFQALREALPDWAELLGIHHGSLDATAREEVESGLRDGRLRCVVATSSLDLGVDYSPVEMVFQVGSPKGVARMLQRAGRSGHRPGAVSEVCCVPANTFELVEIAAARELIRRGEIEARLPLHKPLDVLAQHLLSVAAGGGFVPDDLLAEVRSTHAYRDLSDAEWQWVLHFVQTGGASLGAYSEYQRLLPGADGRWRFDDPKKLTRHRASVGTISSDASVSVRFASGRSLGSVEESFVSRLRPGDTFLFSGRNVELVRFRDLKAVVKLSAKKASGVPRWMGGKMPLSTELGREVRAMLSREAEERETGVEWCHLKHLLEIQRKISRIPRHGEILLEELSSREGYHAFLYPFAGRLVHEGLGALFARRLAGATPASFGIAVNDYGLEILGASRPLVGECWQSLLSEEQLVEDILLSMNSSEMARRAFRGIARVAGLTFEGFPGRRKVVRQIQVSSGLLFDVFRNYEPENLLYRQAFREVLENQLEESKLRATLRDLRTRTLRIVELRSPSPFCYPLLVERLREQVSTESLEVRVSRIQEAILRESASQKNSAQKSKKSAEK